MKSGIILVSEQYVPVKFARLHFENKTCCKVILIDQEGRSFPAYSCHKSFVEEAYITDGWKEFSDANNLKIGDSFVFEFVGNEERPVLQMRGFKAGNNQEDAFSEEKPYIYVTLQASHVRMGQIKLPINFVRMCSAVTIKNEMGWH
ncbi:transcriptional factor B3 family protein [Euphorbia peplus]|nr:transcriptional factor B3 family protein [Euphorbia peplus]